MLKIRIACPAASLLAAFLLAACSTEGDSAPGDVPADTVVAEADHDMEAEPVDHAHAAEPGEGRTLLAIMQDLGVQMASLTHGIMTEDTALVARSAAAIAEHAPIAPEELERIHTALGADTPEFERLDTEVHEASVALHEAAGAGRMGDVLDRLHEVQRGCVACHTSFRQRLLTNPAAH